MREAVRRELRVALSRRAQPVWFRGIKWVTIVVLTVMFWRQSTYWWCLLGFGIAAVGLHLLYRTKTRCWSRAWGGWNDLDAGR